ncbi:MAG: nucleotidyl transferase AbiEii/AbiGii toxin family protein [Flavobacteriales bacterium]|nr:nucleotidyl transferase AbiEii/AbiGii toxin family protein [Flavobacteriales bacterium]MCB9204459.1 nucleotidyl transferase AbiEii/AbiGii toxin family protein [Flavobacteriales bacterium]
MEFDDKVRQFIELANKHEVRLLMVGGGAVNFHGYQRHSADVDFWLDISPENLERLKLALNELGYAFDDFPQEVKQAEQNVSIKISPIQEIELITRFNPGKTFDEAFADAEITTFDDLEVAKYRVLSFEDLINSKIKSSRPKDLLDIQQLKKLKGD